MAKKNSLRRSQLVTPFGPGAINILKGGVSVITGGLDKWFQDQHGNDYGTEKLIKRNLVVKEPRLEGLLDVSHFRLPPSDANRLNTDEPSIFTPTYRFPTWLVCPNCHSMKETNLNNPELIPCENKGCFKEKFQQIRFVVVCPSGHIQDFPWLEWAHKSKSFYDDCKHHLKYNSGGGGTLADIRIRCERCKTPWRGLSNITGAKEDKDGNVKTFLSKSVFDGEDEFLCNGNSPWHGANNVEQCGGQLRAVLTTGSNVHFSEIKSSISIPPINQGGTSELFKILNEDENKSRIQLLTAVEDTILEIAEKFKNRYEIDRFSGYSIEQIVEGVKQCDGSPPGAAAEIYARISEDEIKSQEYVALFSKTERNDELVTHECDLPENPTQIKYGLVDKVIAIEKLKETRVFCGFTRLSHVRSEGAPNPQDQLWKNRPHRREDRWLPASVTFGEGLLINLNNELIKKWEKKEIVKKHVSVLQENMDECQYKFKWPPIEIHPRYVLLHTLSHLLINQLIFECGYSASSLRERIYSNDKENVMSGILIYSASGDSEGTMGGLVRQAEPDLFGNTLENAINKAQWCSADPICNEAFKRGGQGPYSLNMAACHCCCLLPETSCENFNRLMDRSYINFLEDHSIFNV